MSNMSNMQQILSNVTNIQKQLENKQFINRMGGQGFRGYMEQNQFDELGGLMMDSNNG